MSNRRWILFFAIIGSAVGISMALARWTPPAAAKPANDGSPIKIGTPAPEITAKTLDGKAFRLSDLRGEPVVLDFWATWCQPCVESLPHTQQLYERSTQLGYHVVSVTDDDRSAVTGFMQASHYGFPVVMDIDDKATDSYISEGIPTVVVLDAKGNVAAYIVGSGADTEIDDALHSVGVNIK